MTSAKWLRRSMIGAVMVVVAASTVACGGGASESGSRCEPVPTEKLQVIQRGAEKRWEPLRIVAGAAVRSRDYKEVWMIAARFTAPGVPGEVGVWASDRLSEGGTILSVDNVAQLVTVWPDGDRSAFGVSLIDDGVDAAKDCLSR